MRRAAVDEPENAREDRQEDRDLPRLAQVAGDHVLKREADHAGRDRRDEHDPGEPLVGGLEPPRAQRPEPAPHHRREIG